MRIIPTNRVYCRLMADGTVIGPTYTLAYLHHLVKVHKQNEVSKGAKAAAESTQPPLSPENQKWLDELPLSVFLGLY